MKYYKDALYIAAEQAYQAEVVKTEMEPLVIGEDYHFANKEEWIAARVQEWLEEAELLRVAA